MSNGQNDPRPAKKPADLTRAEQRVSKLKDALEEARVKLARANDELVSAVAFSEDDGGFSEGFSDAFAKPKRRSASSIDKKRSVVQRLEREVSELEQAVPVAQERVEKIEERERQRAVKDAEEELRAVLGQRASVLVEMDDAIRRMAQAWDAAEEQNQQLRLAAMRLRRLVHGPPAPNDPVPMDADRFLVRRRGVVRALWHHAPALAKEIGLGFVEFHKRGPLTEVLALKHLPTGGEEDAA